MTKLLMSFCWCYWKSILLFDMLFRFLYILSQALLKRRCVENDWYFEISEISGCLATLLMSPWPMGWKAGEKWWAIKNRITLIMDHIETPAVAGELRRASEQSSVTHNTKSSKFSHALLLCGCAAAIYSAHVFQGFKQHQQYIECNTPCH